MLLISLFCFRMPWWIMCLIFINVDGIYGVFPCWACHDALSYRSLALPFFDCCFCCACGSMYSSKDSFLDKHFEALHRLLWGATEVNIFWITRFNMNIFKHATGYFFFKIRKWLVCFWCQGLRQNPDQPSCHCSRK